MTHSPWRARGFPVALAAPLLMVGVVTGAGPAGAPASAGADWISVPPPSPGTTDNELTDVAVLSPGNAWAVGSDAGNSPGGQTLIEHWNGSAWALVTSPDPANGGNFLTAVRAVSATSIWAVGEDFPGGLEKTLILHWNGTSWKQVASPSPGSTTNELRGISVVSANDVWAVGYVSNDGVHDRTLILHWNGTQWTRVASPDPGGSDDLNAVAAASRGEAWAVGAFGSSRFAATRVLALHWNGTSWKQVAAPSPTRSRSELRGVSLTSPGDAWAAGDTSNGSGQQTLILHWNGAKWTRVPSPDPGGPAIPNFLTGVTATSAGNAWAVGAYSNGVENKAFIVRWNGTRWARMTSPSPGLGNYLFSVAASSSVNAWAVGAFSVAGVNQTMALHCC